MKRARNLRCFSRDWCGFYGPKVNMSLRALYSCEIIQCGDPDIAGVLQGESGCQQAAQFVLPLCRWRSVLLVLSVVLLWDVTAFAGFALSERPQSSDQDFFQAGSLLAQIYPDLFHGQVNVVMKHPCFGGKGAGAGGRASPAIPNDPMPLDSSEPALAVGLIDAAGRGSTSSSGQWNAGNGPVTAGLCSRIMVLTLPRLWNGMSLPEFLRMPSAPNGDVFRPPPARRNVLVF
jgi:hypothetical protein